MDETLQWSLLYDAKYIEIHLECYKKLRAAGNNSPNLVTVVVLD